MLRVVKVEGKLLACYLVVLANRRESGLRQSRGT